MAESLCKVGGATQPFLSLGGVRCYATLSIGVGLSVATRWHLGLVLSYRLQAPLMPTTPMSLTVI